MNNQEFQAVLQSLPVGLDILVNNSSHFDVKGHFEIKEGCTKGVIHITDMSPSKFLKNKETRPGLSEEEKKVRRNNQLIAARMRYAEKKKKEKLASTVPQGSLTGKKPYKIYSPGEKEEMIRDINAGIPFSEINKKYGISRNTYGRFKKQETAPPDVKIDDETQEKIKADVKLGLFTPQILKKYRINIPTYSEIKRSVEAKKKKFAGTTDEDDPSAVKKRLEYGRSLNGDEETGGVSIKDTTPNTRTDTKGVKTSSKGTLKAHRDYLKQNRENIIADIKAGMSAEECVKKWRISKYSYGQYKNVGDRVRGEQLKDLGRPMTPEEREAWLNSMNNKEEGILKKTGDFNFIGAGKNHTRGTDLRALVRI